MRRSENGFFACLVVLSLTSACALIQPTPTPTIIPTLIPTSTPIPTSTATPRPTNTLAPGVTPPTPTRTRTPSMTPLPTSTITRTTVPSPTMTPSPTLFPRPTGKINRIDTRFRSVSLNMDRRILIYLPPGYDQQAKRRYPVLYLLHGYGGFDLPTTTQLEQWGLKDLSESMMLSGQMPPAIIVQPDGFMPSPQVGVWASYWFNHSPNSDNLKWGDYVWKDVVNFVDTNYRTIPDRDHRIIAGFSLGGTGALSIALLHPDLFKVVGAHSPTFRGADGSIPFFGDEAWYNQFDPIWLTQNTNAIKQLDIWLDVGTDDTNVRRCGPESDRCVEAYEVLLVSKNIPHIYHGEWSGPHDAPYWMTHISDYIKWYASKLIGQ
ncbi:MAG: prolyl oligopeptidase family serine peptidase [Chloroflexi bacterium]|nr:prolyl oligopeptidase family serine peptidase [Chloroflexota bacterium]